MCWPSLLQELIELSLAVSLPPAHCQLKLLNCAVKINVILNMHFMFFLQRVGSPIPCDCASGKAQTAEGSVSGVFISTHILSMQNTQIHLSALLCFSAGLVLCLVFTWMMVAAAGRGRSGAETSSPAGMVLGSYTFHPGVFCIKFKSSWISKFIRLYLVIPLL